MLGRFLSAQLGTTDAVRKGGVHTIIPDVCHRGSILAFVFLDIFIGKRSTSSFKILWGFGSIRRATFVSAKVAKTMLAVAWSFGCPAAFADSGGPQTRQAQTVRPFSPESTALLGQATRPGEIREGVQTNSRGLNKARITIRASAPEASQQASNKKLTSWDRRFSVNSEEERVICKLKARLGLFLIERMKRKMDGLRK